MSTAYRDLTVEDPNRIKRTLHKQRYRQAIKRMRVPATSPEVLDFGGGNGEVVHALLQEHPQAKVSVFEPATKYNQEAGENLSRYGRRVRIIADAEELDPGRYSNILCLSVLEHLPTQALQATLEKLHALSNPDTATLIEVPNELYLGGLLKGILRHARRPDEFDGRLRNIAMAALGHPPLDRPESDLDPSVGLAWHEHHMGFDHRKLSSDIHSSGLFSVTGPSFAPIHGLGRYASLDVYYELYPVNQGVN